MKPAITAAPGVRARRRRRAAGKRVLLRFMWLLTLVAGVHVWLLVSERMVIVSGVSMEPTMHTGDLVLVWPRSSYDVGDEIVYRVPEGAPGEGMSVIHRVVNQLDDRLILRGDNNESVDPWEPTTSEIIGGRVLLIPRVGWIIAVVRQPAVLISLASGVFAFALVRRGGSD